MMIDLDAAVAALKALPDVTPQTGVDPLQAALDAANAKVVELQAQVDALQAAGSADKVALQKDEDKIAKASADLSA